AEAGVPADLAFRDPEPEPDEDDDDDDDHEGKSPAQQKLRLENELLKKNLAMMEQKVNELARPRSGASDEEMGRAMTDGALPVLSNAPPLGFGQLGINSQNDLPRGEFFPSPWTPRIQLKHCNCRECKPHRMAHYYCAICHQGPLPYLGTTGPRGR